MSLVAHLNSALAWIYLPSGFPLVKMKSENCGSIQCTLCVYMLAQYRKCVPLVMNSDPILTAVSVKL
jgi:hypothetical protein